MKKYKNSAFTLVELVVVITILAILGTIAFISLQGYSTQARDSTRISDLSSMRTSLELFQLDAGKYPLPTDSFSVVYSGSEVWTQGTFGESTFKNVESLDKIPTDPLDDRKYAYSVTNTRQEYQLSGIMEGDDLVFIGVKAGDKEATAVVTGNYNGNVLKTLSGTTCEILSVPSIISSQDETTIELTTILSAEGLVYNGQNNLPSNFRASKYNADGGFAFTSNKLIAYSDTGSCAPLYDGEDSTARTTLLTNLQTAYSGTILANAGGIKNIVNVDLNDTNAVNLFASSLVNNSLGGDVIISSNGNGVGVVLKNITDCTLIGELIYGTDDGTDVGLTCEDDIIICGGSGTGYTISACNEGANIVYSNQTTGGITVRTTEINEWAGGLYQWGNNSDLSLAGTTGTRVGVVTDINSTYSNPVFITQTDWTSSINLELWGESSNTNLAKKGPCKDGYHVPSTFEWQGLINTGDGVGKIWDRTNTSTEGIELKNALKIPMVGYRYYNDGLIIDEDSKGLYWSVSTNGGSYSRDMRFEPNFIYLEDNEIRGGALSVRCFKN